MKLGLQEKSGGNKIFLAIKHDCICQESKIEREGFEPVKVTNPQTEEESIKFIKRYGGVVALINKIEWRDTGDKYDQRYTSWRIHLDMGDRGAVLELPFQSRHSSRFMKLAENIDYSKPVELRAWYDAKSKSTAFYVGQWKSDDDEKSVKVDQKYMMGQMGDCPEAKERLGGKLDFSDQMEFLHERMMQVVIPKLDALTAMNGHNNETPDSDDGFTSTPLPDRNVLVGEISDLCKQLNEAGEDPKWTSGPAGTLASFARAKYGIEGGLPALSPQQLFEIQTFLKKRLAEKDDDIPF